MNELNKSTRLLSKLIGLVSMAWLVMPSVLLAKSDGELVVEIVEVETGKQVPSRIHLKDARNRTVRARGWGKAGHADHAYIDGTTTLGLKRGIYRFDLDAGPEYRTVAGHFEIERDANDSKRIEVRRFANLAEEGWHSTDLAVARRPNDHNLLLRAEQLDWFANVGWEWKKDQWETVGKIAKGYQPPAGSSALWHDPRGIVWLHDPSGNLTLEQLPQPTGTSSEFLKQARSNGWKIVASPVSWELPIWLSKDLVDAVVTLDGWAAAMSKSKQARLGRPPNHPRFNSPRGPGQWREVIHHQMLESGHTIPTVALSGSGINDNPVGTSRTYYYVGQSDSKLTREVAWGDLLSGKSIVTNGPLLRPFVEAKPPGIDNELPSPLEVLISLNLATRTPVDYLEIIKNGNVAKSVRLKDWAAAGGKLPAIPFDAPGWLTVRAVTNADDYYQYASSNPFYVGKPGERVSRKSCQFFLEWLAEYGEKNSSADLSAAISYWKNRQSQANAD